LTLNLQSIIQMVHQAHKENTQTTKKQS